MNELVTIIIPVYNVQEYLEKCFNSLINQTYKNIEIIIIDDGSKDNSLDICKKYEAEYNSIIKLIHTENKGVSSARNLGLKQAKGNYILFLDSDDYIENNMIEILYNNLKTYDVDISMCNYNKVVGNEILRNDFEIEKKLLNKSEFFNKIFDKRFYRGFLWNKLFKKELLLNNNKFVEFSEEIHMMEDLLFISQVAENATSFYYDDKSFLYNYVQRNSSALNTKFNYKTVTALKVYNILEPLVVKYALDVIDVYLYDYIICAMRTKMFLKREKKLDIDVLKNLNNIRNSKIIAVFRGKNIKFLNKIKLYFISYYTNTYFWLKQKIRNKLVK